MRVFAMRSTAARMTVPSPMTQRPGRTTGTWSQQTPSSVRKPLQTRPTGETTDRKSPAVSSSHKKRLIALKYIWFVVLLGMVAQLVNIQVVQHEELSVRANSQHERPVDTVARRGRITDRSGRDLAVSLNAVSVALNPRQVADPARLARQVSGITGESVTSLLRRFRTRRAFAWVARNVDNDVATRLFNLNPMAMWALPGTKRAHPLASVAGQVIGHVDVDNNGSAGLEMQYDEHLKGRNGWMMSLVDARGERVPNTLQPTVPPVHGGNIQLTLDADYQAIVEHELSLAVERWNARNGLAVLYDASTGAIRAMANVPTYNPLNYARVRDGSLRRNRVVSDPYEPGSTFKTFTAAAALSEGVVTLEEVIDCRGTIHGINDSHPMGEMTFRGVIEHSSNVGTIKVSSRMSDRTFYEYVRRFGFGAETGIGIPGESKGIFSRLSQWSRRSHPSIAMGQEISVTALQLAAAYGAIANDGWLMRPYLVESCSDYNGGSIEQAMPHRVRQVVSSGTATQVAEALCGVVERGTGRNARLPGLRVAGKTGTAQVARSDGSGYEPGAYVASFAGFLPDMNPRLVCVVALTRPHPVYYGGSVAAPVFRRIMSRIINRDADIIEQPDTAVEVMPELTGLSATEAMARADSIGLRVRTVGSGSMVIGQWPPISASRSSVDEVELVLSDADQLGLTVPDVRGEPVRRAVAILSSAGLRVRLRGSGNVYSQWPPPSGNPPSDGVVTLACRLPDLVTMPGNL